MLIADEDPNRPDCFLHLKCICGRLILLSQRSEYAGHADGHVMSAHRAGNAVLGICQTFVAMYKLDEHEGLLSTLPGAKAGLTGPSQSGDLAAAPPIAAMSAAPLHASGKDEPKGGKESKVGKVGKKMSSKASGFFDPHMGGVRRDKSLTAAMGRSESDTLALSSRRRGGAKPRPRRGWGSGNAGAGAVGDGPARDAITEARERVCDLLQVVSDSFPAADVRHRAYALLTRVQHGVGTVTE